MLTPTHRARVNCTIRIGEMHREISAGECVNLDEVVANGLTIADCTKPDFFEPISGDDADEAEDH